MELLMYRAWVYLRAWAFSTFVWSRAFVLPYNQRCYVQEDAIPQGESGSKAIDATALE